MGDPDLENIRKQRLAQLQSQFKVVDCPSVRGYVLLIDIAGWQCKS